MKDREICKVPYTILTKYTDKDIDHIGRLMKRDSNLECNRLK